MTFKEFYQRAYDLGDAGDYISVEVKQSGYKDGNKLPLSFSIWSGNSGKSFISVKSPEDALDSFRKRNEAVTIDIEIEITEEIVTPELPF